MKISVIIPVFNGRQTIRRAITSALGENCYEVLVIDDGSTDGLDQDSLLTLHKSVRYIRKENEGLGPTRNLGIDLSAGDYVFFLDADDEIVAGCFAQLSSAINGNDFVVGKCIRVFVNSEGDIYHEEVWKPQNYLASVTKAQLAIDTISTNKLYSKQFLLDRELRFPNSRFEDKPFTAKLYDSSDRYRIIDAEVYRWYVQDGQLSLSSEYGVAQLLSRMNMVREAIESVRDESIKRGLIENAIKHDLKVHVNACLGYSQNELNQLYDEYLAFYDEYKDWLDFDRFHANRVILESIEDREKTIHNFRKVAQKKLHPSLISRIKKRIKSMW